MVASRTCTNVQLVTFRLNEENGEQPPQHFLEELPLCGVLLAVFLPLFVCILTVNIDWVAAPSWFGI